MSEIATGLLYRFDYEPEGIMRFARRAEDLDFDEMWAAEDSEEALNENMGDLLGRVR